MNKLKANDKGFDDVIEEQAVVYSSVWLLQTDGATCLFNQSILILYLFMNKK